jgi:hypothetical protein
MFGKSVKIYLILSPLSSFLFPLSSAFKKGQRRAKRGEKIKYLPLFSFDGAVKI